MKKDNTFFSPSFWEDREALRAELVSQGDLNEAEDLGFEFLEAEISGFNDKETGCAIDAYDFLHGYCDTFAIELCKVRPECTPIGVFENGKLIHAYVDAPEGYIDIRGIQTDWDELMKTYYDDGLFENGDHTYERQLKRCVCGNKEAKKAARYFMHWYPQYYGLTLKTRPAA